MSAHCDNHASTVFGAFLQDSADEKPESETPQNAVIVGLLGLKRTQQECPDLARFATRFWANYPFSYPSSTPVPFRASWPVFEPFFCPATNQIFACVDRASCVQ